MNTYTIRINNDEIQILADAFQSTETSYDFYSESDLICSFTKHSVIFVIKESV